MKLLFGQFKLIEKALLGFRNDIPLSIYLKDFFKAHRQCGSRDRKLISRLIFNYYRTATAFKDTDLLKQIILSTYLIENILIENNLFSEKLLLSTDLDVRINQLEKFNPDFSFQKVFPFQTVLSSKIDKDNFIHSLLIRPIVWVRVLSEHSNFVENEFKSVGLSFSKNNEYPNAWSLDSDSNLLQLESYKKGYFEIQDISSQQTAGYFNVSENEVWWDCCSGAGGKSLLLSAQEPTVTIFASDVRNSILQNLELRFNKAGIKNFKTSVIDLLNSEVKIPAEFADGFDAIIADVPCTGSGTWARTPEQLSFFNIIQLDEFSDKQFAIVVNASKHLKASGKLIYITCSVFKKENEDVVERIRKQTKLHLTKSGYLKGYNNKADTLFAAQFVK